MRTSTSSAAAILLAGCARRDPPLVDRLWLLDRLRVLAVAAEPAEPRPGETVAFEPLIYVPAGVELDGVAWYACPPAFPIDPDCSAPLADPTWTVPAEILDYLDEYGRAWGVEAQVFLEAPPGGAADHRAEDAAFKLVRISESPTPNHNPLFLGFEVDGEPLDPGEPLLAEPGQAYEIRPLLDESSVEVYTLVLSDTLTAEAEESLSVSWFTEAGSLSLIGSTYPSPGATLWTAPREPLAGLLVAVVQDDRLGMAWGVLRFRVE